MSEKYKVRNDYNPHFITVTVVNWINLLDRPIYKEIILDSFKYCKDHKGLIIHGYVIMSNHYHAIVSSRSGKVYEIVRDMKKFTSKAFIKHIEEHVESRRHWLLAAFRKANNRIKRGEKYKVWQDGYHPVELDNNYMLDQRLTYMHNNPVKAGLVRRAPDYLYSSAAVYEGLENNEIVELLDLD